MASSVISRCTVGLVFVLRRMFSGEGDSVEEKHLTFTVFIAGITALKCTAINDFPLLRTMTNGARVWLRIEINHVGQILMYR